AQGREEGLYRDAVVSEADRLRSVEVLPTAVNEQGAQCPICGSDLADLDPTSADLRSALTEVRLQLADLDAARPRLRDALGHVDEHLANLRDQLRALETAASQLAGS